MYTSKKLERLKAIPGWINTICWACGIGLLILLLAGYRVEAIVAVIFTVAGWAAGYNEASSWFSRLEEERQLWWENRYLREADRLDAKIVELKSQTDEPKREGGNET